MGMVGALCRGLESVTERSHGCSIDVTSYSQWPFGNPYILELSVTVATGLKRLGYAVAAVILIGVGSMALMSLLISSDKVREDAKSEIRKVTGLDLMLRGEAKVSLFPTGSVTFNDVVLGEDGASVPALATGRLTARLRLLPLFIGRIEIADVALDQQSPTVVARQFLGANGLLLDERQMAMLAHLGGIMPFFGFAVPLGLWSAKMGQSAIIEDQAKESLNLQINVLMLMVLAALFLFIPYVGWIVPVGFVIANAIYVYTGAMQAKEGKQFRYPLNVRYIN